MRIKFLLAFSLMFIYHGNVFPQSSDTNNYLLDVTLNYSEAHVLYSQNVQDSFYVYIKLPKYYSEETDKTYPVIYLLDGDIAFPIAWSVVRYLQFGRYVPDVIIVGIGYGGLLYSSKLSKRERDYSISVIEGRSESGGANKFLNFMKYELTPYLESNFRIDNSSKTIYGHSFGGLFTLYTFFSEPQLFSNYIASSPYTYFNVEELLSLEEENRSKIDEANCKLFISYGAAEDFDKYVNPINKIVERLKQRDSSYINLNFRIFEEGVHFSTPSEAMAYGLMHSFK